MLDLNAQSFNRSTNVPSAPTARASFDPSILSSLLQNPSLLKDLLKPK